MDGTLDHLLCLEKRLPGPGAPGISLKFSLLCYRANLDNAMVNSIWRPTNIHWPATQWQGLLKWKLSMTKTDRSSPSKILREYTPRVIHRPYDSDFFFFSESSFPGFISEFNGEHRRAVSWKPFKTVGHEYVSTLFLLKTKTQKAEHICTYFPAEGWIALLPQGFQHQ